MAFEAPNPGLSSTRFEDDGIADLARTAGPGSRDDGAEAMLGEGTIDEESGRPAVVAARGRRPDQVFERASNSVDNGAGLRAGGEDFDLGEWPAGEYLPDFLGGELGHVFVDEIGFGQDNEAAIDSQ
jgi:hypothetical protein